MSACVADLVRAQPQLFAGTRDHSVVAWEPPKQQLEETVSLGGHTGWVRSLATSGQWLFSASCSMVRSNLSPFILGIRACILLLQSWSAGSAAKCSINVCPVLAC